MDSGEAQTGQWYQSQQGEQHWDIVLLPVVVWHHISNNLGIHVHLLASCIRSCVFSK